MWSCLRSLVIFLFISCSFVNKVRDMCSNIFTLMFVLLRYSMYLFLNKLVACRRLVIVFLKKFRELIVDFPMFYLLMS